MAVCVSCCSHDIDSRPACLPGSGRGGRREGPSSCLSLVVFPADTGREAGSFRKVLVCEVIAMRSTCYFYYAFEKGHRPQLYP